MVSLRPLAFGLLASCFGMTSPAIAVDEEHLIQLLESGQCPACQLNDVDLTHADLRDANLKDAELQRANLSQARLDGADLSGSDLSFTSLQGASLRGADLRNSRLIGTDLRRTDLTGALLAPNALDQSHWVGARGVSKNARSHAGLHNAGVDAAHARRWAEAEQLFNAAIEAEPDEPLSWVARGLSRGEQGKDEPLPVISPMPVSCLMNKATTSKQTNYWKPAGLFTTSTTNLMHPVAMALDPP